MKKLISFILVLAIAISMMPSGTAIVFAEEPETPATGGACGTNVSWEYDNGVLTLSGTGPTASYNEINSTPGTDLGFTPDPSVPWNSYLQDITTLVVGDGITKLGEGLFAGCTSLCNVYLPDTLTEIGSVCFWACGNLTDIDIPDSVVSVSDAFEDCCNIQTLTLPVSLCAIASGAFDGMTNLTEIIVPAGNEYFKSADGVVYTSDGSVLVRFPEGKHPASFAIPEDVEEIRSDAFRNCTFDCLVISNSAVNLVQGCFANTTVSTVYFNETKAVWNEIASRAGLSNNELPFPTASIICTDARMGAGVYGPFFVSDYNDNLVNNGTAEYDSEEKVLYIRNNNYTRITMADKGGSTDSRIVVQTAYGIELLNVNINAGNDYPALTYSYRYGGQIYISGDNYLSGAYAIQQTVSDTWFYLSGFGNLTCCAASSNPTIDVAATFTMDFAGTLTVSGGKYGIRCKNGIHSYNYNYSVNIDSSSYAVVDTLNDISGFAQFDYQTGLDNIKFYVSTDKGISESICTPYELKKVSSSSLIIKNNGIVGDYFVKDMNGLATKSGVTLEAEKNVLRVLQPRIISSAKENVWNGYQLDGSIIFETSGGISGLNIYTANPYAVCVKNAGSKLYLGEWNSLNAPTPLKAENGVQIEYLNTSGGSLSLYASDDTITGAIDGYIIAGNRPLALQDEIKYTWNNMHLFSEGTYTSNSRSVYINNIVSGEAVHATQIILDSNGLCANGHLTVVSGCSALFDICSVDTPAGYIFDGYWTQPTGGEKVIDYYDTYNHYLRMTSGAVEGFVLKDGYQYSWCNSADTVTLYAHWEGSGVKKLEIGVGNARALAGQTVQIPIYISTTTGIANLKLSVEYDSSVMKLTKVSDCGVLGIAAHDTSSAALESNPYTLYWDNSKSNTDFAVEGNIVMLSFKLSNAACNGNFPISVYVPGTTKNAIDMNENPLDVTCADGYVSVVEVVCGDTDGDGFITATDSMRMLRYIAGWPGYDKKCDVLAADVDGDADVTLKDATILIRHIAQWTGYSVLPYVDEEEIKAQMPDEGYAFAVDTGNAYVLSGNRLVNTFTIQMMPIGFSDSVSFQLSSKDCIDSSLLDSSGSSWSENIPDVIKYKKSGNTIVSVCAVSVSDVTDSETSGTGQIKINAYGFSTRSNAVLFQSDVKVTVIQDNTDGISSTQPAYYSAMSVSDVKGSWNKYKYHTDSQGKADWIVLYNSSFDGVFNAATLSAVAVQGVFVEADGFKVNLINPVRSQVEAYYISGDNSSVKDQLIGSGYDVLYDMNVADGKIVSVSSMSYSSSVTVTTSTGVTYDSGVVTIDSNVYASICTEGVGDQSCPLNLFLINPTVYKYNRESKLYNLTDITNFTEAITRMNERISFYDTNADGYYDVICIL